MVQRTVYFFTYLVHVGVECQIFFKMYILYFISTFCIKRLRDNTSLVGMPKLFIGMAIGLCKAQLFSTNAVSLNVLSTSTAIYSQYIVNTSIFFTHFDRKQQISRKWHRFYQDQTNSLRVIRLEVLGPKVLVLNVLVLNSCALCKRLFPW